jgi:hypothetical protein
MVLRLDEWFAAPWPCDCARSRWLFRLDPFTHIGHTRAVGIPLSVIDTKLKCYSRTLLTTIDEVLSVANYFSNNYTTPVHKDLLNHLKMNLPVGIKPSDIDAELINIEKLKAIHNQDDAVPDSEFIAAGHFKLAGEPVAAPPDDDSSSSSFVYIHLAPAALPRTAYSIGDVHDHAASGVPITDLALLPASSSVADPLVAAAAVANPIGDVLAVDSATASLTLQLAMANQVIAQKTQHILLMEQMLAQQKTFFELQLNAAQQARPAAPSATYIFNGMAMAQQADMARLMHTVNK